MKFLRFVQLLGLNNVVFVRQGLANLVVIYFQNNNNKSTVLSQPRQSCTGYNLYW